MGKPRVFEFLKTAGTLAGTGVLVAIALFVVSFYEHLNDHNVRASVLTIVAIVCYCWGAYSAWSNERERFEALEVKAARPQIVFIATGEPQDRWFHFKTSSLPPLFELTHLGGEAAQFIQIEPLTSLHSRNVRLEFEQIQFLDAFKRTVVLPFKLLLSGQEINPSDKVQNIAVVFFEADAALFPEQKKLDYPVTIKFKWNDHWESDTVILSWNSVKETLQTSPVS